MALVRPKNVPVANLAGTIANTQLPTIDYSKTPVGSVIQVSHQRYDPNTDGYDVIAIDTRGTSPLVATFTPRFANSKIYINTSMHVRIINANGVMFGITRDGVDLDGMFNGGKDFFYKGDQVNHHYTGRCEGYIDAVSTATSTYRIWARGWSGGTWEMSYGHGEHFITFMEIKQ